MRSCHGVVMRTTLDIDDNLLAIAGVRAREKGSLVRALNAVDRVHVYVINS